MAIPAILPAILGGVQAAAGVYDTNQRVKGQEAANKLNVQLAREQQAWNQAMWNKQNTYNHPSAQMARLKASGLNPHLIYGTSPGSAVGNAGDVAGYNRATVDNTHAGYDAMTKIGQAGTQAVQTSNIMAQTEVAKQEAVAKAYQTLNSSLDADRKSFDLGISKEVRQSSVDAARANAQKIIAEADKAGTDAKTAELLQNPVVKKAQIEVSKALETLKGEQLTNKLKELEYQLNRDLKPYGMTSSDNVWMRLMLHFFSKTDLIP